MEIHTDHLMCVCGVGVTVVQPDAAVRTDESQPLRQTLIQNDGLWNWGKKSKKMMDGEEALQEKADSCRTHTLL